MATPLNRFQKSCRSCALYAARCQALASLANCQNRAERHTTPVPIPQNRVSMSPGFAPSATDDPDMGLDMYLGLLRLVEPIPDMRRAAGCVPARCSRRVADLAFRAVSGRSVRPFLRAPSPWTRGHPLCSVQVFSPCPRTPTSRVSRESSGPCLLSCERPQLHRLFAIQFRSRQNSLSCRNTEHRLMSAEGVFRAFLSPATSACDQGATLAAPAHCAKLRVLGRQLFPVAIEEQTLSGRILADIPHLRVRASVSMTTASFRARSSSHRRLHLHC